MPDELWLSGLSRHADLLGRESLIPRHVSLAGNRRSLGSPLFPRQLEALASGLDVGMSALEVIERHSMLPLIRIFSQPKKVKRAVEAMCGNGNAEMALGLTAMKDYAATLRMCQRCREDDWVNDGPAAWRRSHQAPGTVVCHRHHCALANTKVSCRTTQFVSLTTVDSIQEATVIAVPPAQAADAARIAASMHALLNSDVQPVDSARLAQFYRQHLRAKDLIDSYDRLRFRKFIGGLNERFGPLLPVIGCGAPNPAERDNWLARLVRRPRSEQSPLRHVLLMLFLDLEVVAALAEAAAANPYDGKRRAPTLPLHRSTRITEAKVAAKRSEWLAFLKAAKPGPIRAQNDNLYSWLWRYDRAWLAGTLP